MRYTKQEAKTLIELAQDSIEYGLSHNEALPINVQDYSSNLQATGASFVTLEIAKKLRGCIGSLRAHQPLIVDVVANAWSAAFRDPRFTPVSRAEAKKLEIHISILSEPKPMHFNSEQELLAQLQPGIDGLILIDKGHQGTFLPSVWEQLPEKETFLAHLKNKAGLPQDYWSPTLQVLRYHTDIIE